MPQTALPQVTDFADSGRWVETLMQELISSSDDLDKALARLCTRMVQFFATDFASMVGERGYGFDSSASVRSRAGLLLRQIETALGIYMGRHVILGNLRPDDPPALAKSLVAICMGVASYTLITADGAHGSWESPAEDAVEFFLRSARAVNPA